jgi:hypothetical protein
LDIAFSGYFVFFCKLILFTCGLCAVLFFCMHKFGFHCGFSIEFLN